MYVEKVVEKSPLLAPVSKTDLIFDAFEKRYNVKDAEEVFTFAAKYIEFRDDRPGKHRLARGPWWVKSEFLFPQ